MPLITIEQAVDAVGRCAQAAGGQAVESDVLKRVCRALRAIQPQEPSEEEVERVQEAIREAYGREIGAESLFRMMARAAIAAMKRDGAERKAKER